MTAADRNTAIRLDFARGKSVKTIAQIHNISMELVQEILAPPKLGRPAGARCTVIKPGKPRQLGDSAQRVLNFVIDAICEDNFAPSIREIGDGVGIRAASTIHSHLRKLRELGYIDYKDRIPRSITLKSFAPHQRPREEILQDLVLSYRRAADGNSFFEQQNAEADKALGLIRCADCKRIDFANTRTHTPGGSEIPAGLCRQCGNDFVPF